MNASTLLDFFNHLGKSPTEASTNGVGSSGGRFTNGISAGAIDRVTVKEEPLSEEDLRALQKDRQKKDNHNMSMHPFFLKKKVLVTQHFWISWMVFYLETAEAALYSILEKNR